MKLYRRSLLFILRFLSVVTLGIMQVSGPDGWRATPDLYRWIMLAYAVWVLLGWALKPKLYRKTTILVTLFLVDTVLALVLLQGLSSLYGELFLIYFVTIFVAVLAQSVSGGVAAAVLSILLYAFLQYLRTGQYFIFDADHLIRYPFILVTGVLCGFLAEEGQRDDGEKKRLRDTTNMLADKVDLATRKLIESNHSLKAMLDYHKRILSCIQTGIVVAHQDGIIKTFNDGAVRITGFSEEVVDEKSLQELPERLGPLAKALQKTLSEGKGYNLENLEITTARGEVLPVSLQTSVMRSEEGQVLGAIATLKDISLLRQMEIQLTRS